ncbi:hypothetical protein P9112_014115 [Eukaryota sp. TZLM1-RC]
MPRKRDIAWDYVIELSCDDSDPDCTINLDSPEVIPIEKNYTHQCVYCSLKYTPGSATRIKNHIVGVPPGERSNISVCMEAPRKTIMKLLNTQLDTLSPFAKKRLSFISEGAPIKKKPLNTLISNGKLKAARTAVGDFFYGCGIPLRIIRSKWFWKMIKAIAAAGPSVQKIGYNALRTTMLDNRYKDAVTERKAVIDNISDIGCTVMADSFTSVSKHSLTGIMASTGNSVIHLKTVHNDAVSQNGDYLKQVLEQVISELNGKVVNIVTD